jgi:hypothetical protein
MLDFDETKLRAGKSGRKEREDILTRQTERWLSVSYRWDAKRSMTVIPGCLAWLVSNRVNAFYVLLGRPSFPSALSPSSTLRIPTTAKFSLINTIGHAHSLTTKMTKMKRRKGGWRGKRDPGHRSSCIISLLPLLVFAEPLPVLALGAAIAHRRP